MSRRFFFCAIIAEMYGGQEDFEGISEGQELTGKVVKVDASRRVMSHGQDVEVRWFEWSCLLAYTRLRFFPMRAGC